ncbi:hypothetical protein LTR85_010372 [Meristemomyces frigidus]|nr:hypothetical protein LTR85_010372 [Meristemomyces frigidus]
MQITCKVWPAQRRGGFSAESTPNTVTDREPKYVVACAAEADETVHDVLKRADAKLVKLAGKEPGYLDPSYDDVQNMDGAAIDCDDLTGELFENTTLTERVLHIRQGLRPGTLLDKMGNAPEAVEPQSKTRAAPETERRKRKKVDAPDTEQRTSRKRGAPDTGEQRASKKFKTRTEVLTPSSIPADLSSSQEAPTSAQRPRALTQQTPISAQVPRSSTHKVSKSTQRPKSSQRQRPAVGKGEKKVVWTADEDTYFAQGLNDGLTTRQALDKYGINRTKGAARARKTILAGKGLIKDPTSTPAINTGSQLASDSQPNSSGVLDLASSPPQNAITRRGASPQVIVPSTEKNENRSSQGSQPFLGGRSGSGGRQTTLDFWSANPSKSHILSDSSPADRAANGPARQQQKASSSRRAPTTVAARLRSAIPALDGAAETQVVPSSVPAQAGAIEQSVDLTAVEDDDDQDEEPEYGMPIGVDGANDAADDTFMHIDEVEDHRNDDITAANGLEDGPAALGNDEEDSSSEEESDEEEASEEEAEEEEVPSGNQSNHSCTSKSPAAQPLNNTRTIEDSQPESAMSSTSSPPLVKAQSPAITCAVQQGSPSAVIEMAGNDSSSTDGQDDLEQVAALSAQEALDTQLQQRSEDGRNFGLGVSAPVVHLPEQTARPRLRAPDFGDQPKGYYDKTDKEIMQRTLKQVRDPTDEKEVRRAFEDNKHSFITCLNVAKHRTELNAPLYRIQKKRAWDRALEDGIEPPPRRRRRHGVVRGDRGAADEEIDYGSDYSYPSSGQYEREEYPSDVDWDDDEVDEKVAYEAVPPSRSFPRLPLPPIPGRVEEVESEVASEQEIEDGAGDEAEDVAQERQPEEVVEEEVVSHENEVVQEEVIDEEEDEEDGPALPQPSEASNLVVVPAVEKEMQQVALPELDVAAPAETPASTSPVPALHSKRTKSSKRAARDARAIADEADEAEDDAPLPQASDAIRCNASATEKTMGPPALPEVAVTSSALVSDPASASSAAAARLDKRTKRAARRRRASDRRRSLRESSDAAMMSSDARLLSSEACMEGSEA